LVLPSTISITSAPIASITLPLRGRLPWKNDSGTAQPEFSGEQPRIAAQLILNGRVKTCLTAMTSSMSRSSLFLDLV
jgi:hypothetical protein